MSTPAEPFSLFKWLMGDLPTVEVGIHLYKTFTAGDGPVTIANFVESTFPGYAPKAFRQVGNRAEVPGRSVIVTGAIVPFAWVGHDAGDEIVEGHYEVAVYPDGHRVLVIWQALDTPQLISSRNLNFGVSVTLTATIIAVARQR